MSLGPERTIYGILYFECGFWYCSTIDYDVIIHIDHRGLQQLYGCHVTNKKEFKND